MSTDNTLFRNNNLSVHSGQRWYFALLSIFSPQKWQTNSSGNNKNHLIDPFHPPKKLTAFALIYNQVQNTSWQFYCYLTS